MKTLIQARNDEFIAICLGIMARRRNSGDRIVLTQIIDEALLRRPRCHYTSYDNASRILHYIGQSGVAAMPRRLAVLKWLELYNQVKDAMEGPRRLPFDKALTFVLSFCRPSRFYIDRTRALRLLSHHLRRQPHLQTSNS